MDKSEVIQKVIWITSENIGWYQLLVIDIISFHSVKNTILFVFDMHWFHCKVRNKILHVWRRIAMIYQTNTKSAIPYLIYQNAWKIDQNEKG